MLFLVLPLTLYLATRTAADVDTLSPDLANAKDSEQGGCTGPCGENDTFASGANPSSQVQHGRHHLFVSRVLRRESGMVESHRSVKAMHDSTLSMLTVPRCIGACELPVNDTLHEHGLRSPKSPWRSRTIPNRLWQTYPDPSKMSSRMRSIQASWHRSSPSLLISLSNDTETSNLVRNASSQLSAKRQGGPSALQGSNSTKIPTLFEAFNLMPLGVMKADIWRYTALWLNGGIYADIDVETHVNMTQLIGSHPACKVLIGLEYEPEWCQWIIAGVKGHPVFKRALELIQMRAMHGINISLVQAVNWYTGPFLWTQAIQDVLMGDEKKDSPEARPRAPAGQLLREMSTNPGSNLVQRAKSLGMCFFDKSFTHKSTTNLYASQMNKADRGSLKSWTKTHDKMREKLRNMLHHASLDIERLDGLIVSGDARLQGRAATNLSDELQVLQQYLQTDAAALND